MAMITLPNRTPSKDNIYQNFPKTYIDQAIEEAIEDNKTNKKSRDGRLFFKELRANLKKKYSTLKKA